MKMIRSGMLGLVVLFASAVCRADWSGPLTVSKAFTEDSDAIVIYTSDADNYTRCSLNSWYFRASTDARRGRAWATILTALTTGQKVQLWYNAGCGTWNYFDVTSIMLVAP